MFVAKFGGTSVKDGKTIKHVVDNIILQNRRRRVVVLSAPGKRSAHDVKVTDLLLEAGDAYLSSHSYPRQLVARVRERFTDITDYFGIGSELLDPAFTALEVAIRKSDGNRSAYMDGIAPIGEIINAQIFAAVLRQRNIGAGCYTPENIGIFTDGNFGNAKLRDYSYAKIAESLMPLIEHSKEIIVVPGFYGVTENRRWTTFSRGGSDLTGAILANALDASRYENWTDTDGIRRVDPKVVSDAGIIEKLTYREARELAYSGAQILHPDTLAPLADKRIPLNVRNTFNPGHTGTYVVVSRRRKDSIVEGIAYKEGFAIINVEKNGMNEQVGYLHRLLGIFAEMDVSIDQMTTSVDSVSLAIFTNGHKGGKIEQITGKITDESLADKVTVAYDRALVCVVGEGMRHAPGVMATVAGALAKRGISM